jgi:2,3-bisphosphoglycerate-dependent phosphoglycerate mutase
MKWGVATGWHDGQLSERGRALAAELGMRRCHDGIAAVFASDLGRAVETAKIAFAHTNTPVFLDWRLRECNYGDLNGSHVEKVHDERWRYLDRPYPNGESWRQAITRVGRFLPDIRHFRAGKRILVIGHAATRWAFDHFLQGLPIEVLITQSFGWREGWEYRLV